MGFFARAAPEPGTPEPARPTLRVLRADGQRIDLTKRDSGQLLVATKQGWQRDALAYRDMIGELRLAHRLLARAVARVRFYPAEARPWPLDPVPLDGDEHGIDSQLAADAVLNFANLPIDSNPDGFIARLVENLAITGEGWVHLDRDGQFWVRSVSEISVSADNRVMLATLPGSVAGSSRQIDPQQEDLLRCWIPHPEWGGLADSPMRAVIDVCEDVVLAGREQRAAARSRLAANGVMFIPDSMSLVRDRSEDDLSDGSISSDTFMADFVEAVTASIRDDGDAQMVVPIIIRGDKDDIAAVKHIRFDREDSEQLIARQGAAITRLLRGVDVQVEQVEGVGATNHWCVDEQTEALTRHGWVSQNVLRAGDEVLTLNHETGLSEWQPVLDIYRADVEDEVMVSMETGAHSSLTTPGHRWPVVRNCGGKNRNVAGEWIDGRHKRREWATSDTLTVRDSIPTCAVSADRPDTAKYEDAFVELVGWFWTEGNISRCNGASIAQSHTRNPARVDRIRAALTRTYGPAVPTTAGLGRPGWRESIQLNTSSFGGPITVFHLNQAAAAPLIDACPGKLVSQDFVHALTPAQLDLFVDISAQGDGWHYRSGRLDMWQRNPDALDGYELALILSGRTVTRGVSGDGHWVNPLRKRSTNPVAASAEARRKGRGVEVAQQRYTGTVWCPVTPNGTWFARRNGTSYFTGNSSWSVDARAIRDQVQPMAETVAACLAAAYLRPAMSAIAGRDHDPEQVRRICIAADVSPLTENPNRGQDARDAHAAGVISDEAMRTALNFDADDAPDDKEMVKRLARDGRLPVEVSAQILGLKQPERERETITVQGETVRPALPAPTARPAAVPGELHPARTTPAEPTRIEPAGPVIAAATPDPLDGWRVDTDASRRLADIDAALTERVTIASDDAVQRVLERAGARVRTAAGRTAKDKALAASLVGVDAHLIPAAVGREQVEVFTPVADLIADGYDRLHAQVDGWLGDAAVQTADAVCAVLGLDTQGVRGRTVHGQVLSRLTTTAAQAWPILAAALDEAAEDGLFDPDEDDEEQGETSPGLVPVQAITDALAAAGGELPTLTAAGGYGGGRKRRQRRPIKRKPGAIPTTGPATGPIVRGVVADQGGVLIGYQWHYKPELSRTTFDPHKQLDGQRFLSWRDPILATDTATAWVGDYFHPRDHRGCRCVASVVVGTVEDPESVMAQAIRDAHGDPSRVLFGGTADTPSGTPRPDTADLRSRINAAVDAMRNDHVSTRKGRKR